MKDNSLENIKKQIHEAQKHLKSSSVSSRRYGPRRRTGRWINAGIEFVSGVFVGVGLGLLLDWVFGTSPWGLISLFILGSGAGMLNLYRTLTFEEKRDKKKDTHV